jgi:hypothetical protein
MNALVNDKIYNFLQETELQKQCRAMGTWGLGSVIVRASGKLIDKCMPVKTETDQVVLSVNHEAAMPVIADTLKKIGRMVKDPALFDIPTASFAVLMATVSKVDKWLSGNETMVPSCLVFVTLKPLSENSTHVLLEGYTKTFGQGRPWGTKYGAFHELTRVRDEISTRFV